jgi:hypothetical protein
VSNGIAHTIWVSASEHISLGKSELKTLNKNLGALMESILAIDWGERLAGSKGRDRELSSFNLIRAES